MAQPMPPERLEGLVERLEQIAKALRSGDLEPDTAAELVEECARLAAQAGAELDRLVRGEPAP
jgi:exonuclease VII small subunit